MNEKRFRRHYRDEGWAVRKRGGEPSREPVPLTTAPTSPARRTSSATSQPASTGTIPIPRKPQQNWFIESCNWRFRDAFVNETLFSTLGESRELLAAWRDDNSLVRPHSALANRTPGEFHDHHLALAVTNDKVQTFSSETHPLTGGKKGLRSIVVEHFQPEII